MAATLPPGIGNPQQAMQATAFMRQQPWYAQLVKSWGYDPSKTDSNGNLVDPRTGQSVKLSDEQQQQLIAAARDSGIGISNSYNIDQNGQIAKPDSHMLRNIAIAAGITGAMFIPGVGPAVLAGLKGAGTGIMAGLKGAGTALTAGKGAAGALGAAGKVGNVISAGSKIADLFNTGQDITNSFGNAAAQRAQAETNNRFLQARTDQLGPASDAQAFRNAMRAGIVARMDPNAAPLNIGAYSLPSLVNPGTVDYAKTMFNNLSTRQAAGKTPTEFGVPDPSAQEAADTAAAGRYSTVGNVLGAGSKIANLLNLFRTNTDTSGDGGGIPIPGGEFDPNVVYG